MRTHVLMVAERMLPAIGGVERHVGGLASALVNRGYRVSVVAPAHEPNLSTTEVIDNVTVHRIRLSNRSRRKYFAAWRWWWKNRYLVRSADLLHFHDVYALLHWSGPILLLSIKRPRYITFHGYEMAYPIPFRARFYRKLADRLVSGSIAVGHYLPKWFDIHPNVITYGGVDIPAETSPLPPAHQALFVGRLAEDTGIHIYLEGLRVLQDDYGISLPATVCGDGPERESAEHHARALKAPVTFKGFTSVPEQLYRQCSVAFASGYLAMLEAMAHRRPVFSVFHSIVKSDYLSLIPEADRLFTVSSSPEELAERLKRFIAGDPLFKVQIDHAFAFASACTWPALAGAYESLWSSDR